MIPPRLARRIASLHKWLGLVVGAQLLIWTATGLFFTVIHITQVRGEHLIRPPAPALVDMSRVKLSSTEALGVVVEDRPRLVTLRMLGDEPVYDIRADIGVFVVSAVSGRILSPVTEDVARAVALDQWLGGSDIDSIDYLETPPRESGFGGPVWAVRFGGPERAVLYVNAATGEAGPVRTGLWRTYDFLWSLHIMDYDSRENFNHPLIIAAAVLALSVVLLGFALLTHRLARMQGNGRRKKADDRS